MLVLAFKARAGGGRETVAILATGTRLLIAAKRSLNNHNAVCSAILQAGLVPLLCQLFGLVAAEQAVQVATSRVGCDIQASMGYQGLWNVWPFVGQRQMQAVTRNKQRSIEQVR